MDVQRHRVTMRVTIDYTSAMRQRAGVGRYTRNLVSALAQLDRENSYTLFCAGGGPRSEDWPDNFTVRTSRVPERFLIAGWHKLRLPLPAESIAGRADIFHAPDFTLPPLSGAAGIVTIHDLSFLKAPQCADPGLREYLTRRVPVSVGRAARVLADSENTRRDLIELLGVAAEKISVVYAGVEPRFHAEQDPSRLAQVRARYQLPEFFLLFVGTIEPRKNLKRLITAYSHMRRQIGLPHQLVIGGANGWLYEDIFAQVVREGLSENVKFLGFVADEDLPALYTLADLFAFPSLYEGFGLPPLEAMACGTPVVASNTSSLPEVLGSAARLVDAEDVDGLSDAMASVLGDAELRSRLANSGRAQAARYTWENAARQLVEAYRAVMP
jgi:glycosyltransferase involved in cell wall biosynthesis